MPLERLGQCARGYPRVTLRLQAQALALAVYELAHPDVSVCGAAVVESAETGGHDAPFIGVCALDTAAGQLLVGAWRDDEVRAAGHTPTHAPAAFLAHSTL